MLCVVVVGVPVVCLTCVVVVGGGVDVCSCWRVCFCQCYVLSFCCV